MPEVPDKITFVYEKTSQKPTLSATGAFGGPVPNGSSVVVHLYVEHFTVPNYVTHDVQEDGQIDLRHGDEIKRGDATREVQATLVLSPEAAREIGDWLVQKANLAYNLRKKTSPSGFPEE